MALGLSAYLEDGVQDELGEGTGKFLSVRAVGRLAEFTSGWVKVPERAEKSFTLNYKTHVET